MQVDEEGDLDMKDKVVLLANEVDMAEVLDMCGSWWKRLGSWERQWQRTRW